MTHIDRPARSTRIQLNYDAVVASYINDISERPAARASSDEQLRLPQRVRGEDHARGLCGASSTPSLLR
jgi:hypothetical protein